MSLRCPILKTLAIKDILCYNGHCIKDMQTDIKKTEKLVSALYLITSFFADLEPMKWRLRELGNKLLGAKEGKSLVQEILSLLNVAKNSGLVSDMNYNIIYKEFSNLISLGDNLADLLKIEERPQAQVTLERLPQTTEAPVIKDKIYKPEPKEPLKDGAVAVKKNGRQSVILGLLKKKGEIMIKDVSPLIEGVSEKTIQRELLALVKGGVLRKEGEKRWSRYSLAN